MKSLFVTMTGKAAFFLGVALAFDMTGSLGLVLQSVLPPKSAAPISDPGRDAANLSGDWRSVGADFRNARTRLENER